MKKLFSGNIIFRPGTGQGIQKWSGKRRGLWASQKKRLVLPQRIQSKLPSHRGARTTLAGRHR